jgi:hypothetical protein
MIDIATEQLLNLDEAARRLPLHRGGRPVSPATLWRWIQRGQLEGLRLGSRWLTSTQALQRYCNRRTRAALKTKLGI